MERRKTLEEEGCPQKGAFSFLLCFSPPHTLDNGTTVWYNGGTESAEETKRGRKNG